MSMTKLHLGAATLATALALAGSTEAQTQLAIGSSSSGSGPYINGAAISEVFNRAQREYRMSVQTTGGYRDNLGLILGGGVDVAMSTLIDVEFAYNARGDFAEMGDSFTNLRQLFIFSVEPQNFIVRADSGITSLDEIRGRAININTPASFTYGMNLALLEAAGLSTDDFQPGTVSTGQVFDEIRNRVFDGGLHVYQVGLANAQQLSSTVDVNYISFDAAVIERLNEGYFGLLVPFEIPGGVYRGQDESVETFGLAQVLFTNADADEEMIYQFTKTFWENLETLSGTSTSFQGLTLELGTRQNSVPMHPGALRYFTEIGAITQ